MPEPWRPLPGVAPSISWAWIEKEVGGHIDININPLGATVGTTTTQVLKSNANRWSFFIMNMSSFDGYVAPNPSVGTTYGIKLRANGGYVAMNLKEDLELVMHDWFAISPAGAATYWIIENVFYTGKGVQMTAEEAGAI